MALQYKKAKGLILKEIHAMKPGEKIRSRTQIGHDLGISRATATKAIKEIVSDGLLYTIMGSGTFVSRDSSNNQSIQWAVVLPDLLKESYPEIVNGIEAFTSERGIDLLLYNSNNNPIRQQKLITNINKLNISGCVIVPNVDDTNNYATYKMLRESNVACVFCHRLPNGYMNAPLVAPNNYYGAYIATRALIKSGCKRLAYVSKSNYVVSVQRYSGFVAALYEYDLLPQTENVIILPKTRSYETELVEIFDRKDHPDGVLCFNDLVASDVYEVLCKLGIKIGTEVKLIGYDNMDVCDAMNPKLTSVSAEARQIGFRAAEMLYGIIRGKPICNQQLLLIKPHIVYRSSLAEN